MHSKLKVLVDAARAAAAQELPYMGVLGYTRVVMYIGYISEMQVLWTL